MQTIEELTAYYKSIQICPLGLGYFEFTLKKLTTNLQEQAEYFKWYTEESGNPIPKLINRIPYSKLSPIEAHITNICNDKQKEDFLEEENQINFLKFCIWWMEDYNKGLVGEV
jgi:hypothetical protein